MFKVGELVQHKKIGKIGRIVGYGCLSDRYDLTTLKVELLSHSPVSLIAEDVVSKWQVRQNKRVLACTLPHFPKKGKTA